MSDGEAYRPSESLLREQLGQIVGTFTVHTIPHGAAPETIKQQWLGVSLPVRERLLESVLGGTVYLDILSSDVKVNPQPMPVYGFDAVAALRKAGRVEAADFWADQGFEFATMQFRCNEGDFESIQPEG
jgi:hypothetical protein